MLRNYIRIITVIFSAMPALAAAESVEVPMYRTSADGVGANIGVVTIEDSKIGAVFRPDLRDLEPGEHGFHVHQNPNCGAKEKNGKPVPGLAAGGHFDPESSGSHKGPEGSGHLGDLPRLKVKRDGTATKPVVAPRLKVRQIRGRSLMIHASGDNYSDDPKKLGGGGARVACGVIR